MENEVLDQELLIENQASQHQYAGFWIRVGASFIDLLAYSPVLGLNIYNIYFLKNLPVQVATTLLLLVYKPFMEYRYGATLGKMALKIKVIDGNANSITIPQAFIRNAPSIVSQVISLIGAVLLFTNSDFESASSMAEVASLQKEVMSPIPNYLATIFYFISCIVVGTSAKKQGIHDQMAGTYCIKH